MNERNEMTRDDELLHAYYDGELSGFARRRFEQRLRRSPALQAELDSLDSLGGSLRALDADGPSPDLWDDIALRLPALDAQRDAEVAPERSGWLAWLFGPAGAALATAAAAVALALTIYTPEIQPGGSTIRWLDTGGRSVMVIDDDADMTIIWMLDGGEGGGVS